MPFRVSGKNIDIGDALRNRVNQRIAEATSKYFDGGFSGHVTVGREGHGFRTECVIHLDSGIVLEAEATAADAYASADAAKFAAVDAPSYVLSAPEHDEETAEWHPVVIAESTTALKRQSVSEAVMELDLRGVAVVVFRHAGHGRINLVYRRADGHIGWIDPPPIETDAH
jgi:ribosomal subunit interface protein